MGQAFSIILAFAGFTLFSAGIVLMKAGSPWLKWQGIKNGRFHKTLAIWAAGFALYNLALIPNIMASKALPAYLISAISGWGIVVIVLLSAWLLKEQIYAADYLYAALIVAGIFVLNISEKAAVIGQIDKPAFYGLFALPFLLLLPALFKNVAVKAKAVLFSVFSGCVVGFSFVILNVVTKEYGFDVLRYFGTPYPYLFISSGIISFFALQLAMRWGKMMLVGPLQNSLTIIYPAICSYLIFNVRLSIVQIASIIVIVFSCLAILKKH